MGFDKIIVLDDELIIRKSLEEQLRRRRYSVASASNLQEVFALLEKDHFDLIFADVSLPDGDGRELLDHFAERPEAPLVVMITGNASVESAVECMRKGAFDYLIKPFSSDQIEVLLKKAESFSQMVKVNRFYATSSSDTSDTELLGRSRHIQQLRRLIQRVAKTEATVLITGENGTGKELVAQELYRSSHLSGQPFIKVNCAAISETLIESEFFGHEKGAFTGATQRREGRFELANNGTILLDEIGEIPPRLQAKLLRVLQEKEFERVGGNKTISVNVRVLATTNRDLLAEVEKGRFREDLYYRLNVFPIHVAALRERAEDSLLLAKEFLKRFSRKHGIQIAGFTKEAIAAIEQHDWPGNVRELQNTIERAVILTEDGESVDVDSLGLVQRRQRHVAAPAAAHAADLADDYSEEPVLSYRPASPAHAQAEEAAAPTPRAPSSQSAEFPSLEEMEKQCILSALERTEGNRTRAADILKISIRTLRNKLQQYRENGELIP